MGAKLPAVSGKRVLQALTRSGFIVERIVGSHHVLVYSGDPSRTVTVPLHGNRDSQTRNASLDYSKGGIHGRAFSDLL